MGSPWRVIWTGRAGAPEALQAGPGSFRPGGVPAGPGVLLLIRDGVLQDWERILSFFGIVICNVLIFR